MADHMRHIFTSESVTEGHPDKMADQISRRRSRRGAGGRSHRPRRVRNVGNHRSLYCGRHGEITTTTVLDVPQDRRAEVIEMHIGLHRCQDGLRRQDLRRPARVVQTQSPDIAMGVDTGGEGDRRPDVSATPAMNPAEELMPLPISCWRTSLVPAVELKDPPLRQAQLPAPRRQSQVGVEYVHGHPKRIDAVVVLQRSMTMTIAPGAAPRRRQEAHHRSRYSLRHGRFGHQVSHQSHRAVRGSADRTATPDFALPQDHRRYLYGGMGPSRRRCVLR